LIGSQVVARLFLPPLLVDFRDRHFVGLARSLHIARNDRGGGNSTEKPERDPGRHQTPLRRVQPTAVPASAFSREAGSFGL
jgi:hypothetical protein